MVQLEKYFDFSLLSLTSLLSAPEREVTSPSDFKVVGALTIRVIIVLSTNTPQIMWFGYASVLIYHS